MDWCSVFDINLKSFNDVPLAPAVNFMNLSLHHDKETLNTPVMSDFRFCIRIMSPTFPRVWLGWKLLETRNDETMQKNPFTRNQIDLSDFDFISIWNPSEPLDSSNTFWDSFALTTRTNEPRRGHDMLLDHFEFMDRSPQVLSGDHHAEVPWIDCLTRLWCYFSKREREERLTTTTFVWLKFCGSIPRRKVWLLAAESDEWIRMICFQVLGIYTLSGWFWKFILNQLCPDFVDWFQVFIERNQTCELKKTEHVIVHENETCQVDGDVEFRDVEFLEIEIRS